jgi:hypothetical protein
MQYPQTNVVSRTEQGAILEIHKNDGEDANNPLKSALAPTIKQTNRKHAVGHCTQVACRNTQNAAELRTIVDAAIKQRNKPIARKEGLYF